MKRDDARLKRTKKMHKITSFERLIEFLTITVKCKISVVLKIKYKDKFYLRNFVAVLLVSFWNSFSTRAKSLTSCSFCSFKFVLKFHLKNVRNDDFKN
jgi:hypothetical protein